MARPQTAVPRLDSENGSQGRDTLPGLPGDVLEHLALSLKRQWKRYRKRLRRCQRKFSTRAVHESRVETRRLLSLLELLRPFAQKRRLEKALACLKRHLDTFDDLRDTHVQLLAVGPMRAGFPAAGPFYKYLRKREQRFERQTRKRIKAVRTRRLEKLIADCRQEVRARIEADPNRRARRVLLGALERAFARTAELKARISPKDTKTIHRTRVAFKRYRYMVELLAERLPAATTTALAAMHDYQTMMGEVQDAEVLLRALGAFLGKKRLDSEAARQFRGECLRRRHRLVQVYLRAADGLFAFRTELWLRGARAGQPRVAGAGDPAVWRPPHESNKV